MVERRLVPVKTLEEAKLSPKQEKEILDMSRMYLRRHKISVTESSLRQTMGVLGDALRRGLEASGQETFGSGGRLKPYIKTGLLYREQLREEIENILEITVKSSAIDQNYLGPLALPTPLIGLARTEQRNFHLVPEPKASQNLVNLGQQRLPLLDRLAGIALAHLPEGLKEVSLETFPEISDRAKIVRNMIASFIHRDSLCPLITTFDLKDFAKSGHYFTEERLESLSSLLGQQYQGERPYLEALFSQTEDVFSAVQGMPLDDDSAKIDYLYTQFSRSLLLLHPALEEPQIVVQPQKIELGVRHLWEDAAAFGGVKIPRPGLLVQALRQARARDDITSQDRFSAALRHWRWFSRESHKQESEIRTIRQNITRDRWLLKKLPDPNFPLPKEAYLLRTEGQYRVFRKATSLKGEAKHFGSIIHKIVEAQREAKKYRQYLKKRHQDGWPDTLPMPRGVFLQGLEAEAGKLRFKEHSAKSELSVMEQLIHGELLWFGEVIPRHGFLFKEGTREWAEQELKQSESTLAQAEGSPGSLSLTKETFRKALDNFTVAFSWLKSSRYYRGVLSEYCKIWDQRLPVLMEAADSGGFDVLMRQIAPQILQGRISLLKAAISAVNQREKSESLLGEARERLRVFKKNPQEPLPDEAVWSKDEAISYLAEMEVTDLLRLLKDQKNLDKLGQEAGEMRSQFFRFPLTILPKTISSNSQLRAWLEEEIGYLKEQITAGGATKTNRKKLEVAKFLTEHLGHPLLPSFIGVDIKGEDFVMILRRRTGLAYALSRRQRIAGESKMAQEVYQRLMRDEYIQTVAWRLESERETLAQLEERNIAEELIDRMRALNLVLD